MGSRNENGSFVHRYLLYEQVMFFKNECRVTSLEDMYEGAAQNDT